MKLRSTVRRTKTSGAKMFATAESVAMGYATVRLATNGARISNLPVHGTLPDIGDKVVIDYSSEGKPYVRRYTAQPNELDPTLSAVTWDRELDPATDIPLDSSTIPDVPYKACQLSLSSSYTWQYTGIATSHHIRFDRVDFDTSDGEMPELGYFGYTVRGPGTYFVNFCFGMDDPYNEDGEYFEVKPVVRSRPFPLGLSYRVGGKKWGPWRNTGDGRQIFTGSTVVPVYDELQRINLFIRAYSAYAPDYIDLPVAVDPGKYPIMTVWKISDAIPTEGDGAWGPMDL